MHRDFGKKTLKPKKKFKKYRYITIVLIISVISIYSFIKFDNKLKIIVSANSDILAKTLAIEAIDKSVNNIINKENIKSENFILRNLDNNGNINTISANTILINDICSRIAVNIAKDLGLLGVKEISVSLGTLTGISSFANRGYNIPVNILPYGTADVNYNTKFYSVGINQINFQVWLDINVTVTIITPMENRKITINRSLILVDIIIKGDVPPNYINTNPNDVLELIPENR